MDLTHRLTNLHDGHQDDDDDDDDDDNDGDSQESCQDVDETKFNHDVGSVVLCLVLNRY